jgi:hypothetical protein
MQLSIQILLILKNLRRFLEIDQSEKRIVWQPCLLMNRDEMTNLSRGPSKDAPYQVSIHLAKQ